MNEITLIDELAIKVNESFKSGNNHAQWAMEHYLKAGQYLAQARRELKGDRQFGQWRSKHTDVSKSWATKLLSVYETYGDVAPANLSFSALAEIANAPEAVREAVEQAAADDNVKTPSVREIREAVREAREEETPEITGTEGLPDEVMPVAMRERLDREAREEAYVKEQAKISNDPVTKAQRIIDLDYADRMAYWQKLKNPTAHDGFILLGLPPFFDGLPNMETLTLIAHALMYDVDHPAIVAIREEYFDEH